MRRSMTFANDGISIELMVWLSEKKDAPQHNE